MQASDQVKPVDEAFLLWMQGTSCSPPLILMGGFSHPDICRESNTGICKQCRPSWSVQGTTSQARHWPDQPRRSVTRDGDELIRGVKSGHSLGCSDHVLVKFVIFWRMGLARTMVKTLKVRRENCNLLKELVNEIPWESVLKDTGADQSWQHFKATFLRAQHHNV